MTAGYYRTGIGAHHHLRARLTCETCGWSLSEAVSPPPTDREMELSGRPNTYVPLDEADHHLPGFEIRTAKYVALLRLGAIHTLRWHPERVTDPPHLEEAVTDVRKEAAG